MKTKCKACSKCHFFYGEDIKCPKHRKPGKNGYRVGCTKCDVVLISDSPEDSMCGNCAGEY